ncbi:MAG TPA: ABC transporter permease subunit [Bacteroidota bacterium]|nr:ABC transporter permease subunit [Bacteroidota bacterium]
MNPALKKLFAVEMRRLWTIPMIVLSIVMLPLGLPFSPIIATLINRANHGAVPVLNLSESVNAIFGALSLYGAMFFSAGIVGGEVKNGWMRSVLSRPITRQWFLAVKMAAVVLSVFCTIILVAIILLGVSAAMMHAMPAVHPLQLAQILLGSLGQIVTYVAIATVFSCFFPGNFNLIALFLWEILGGAATILVQKFLWNNKWMFILDDLLFPHRLTGFADSVLQNNFASSDLLWGTASLALFLAGCFWFVNVIQVDKTAD